MADPQTPDITPPPAGGVPFTPVNNFVEDTFTRKPSDVEMSLMLQEAKPKTSGEALSIGVAQYMLDNKKNYEGAQKSTKQVANRMIAQRSDVLNEVNTQEVDPPDDKAIKELKKQKEEFTRELKDRYDIPADQIKEGVILPVPKNYNSDYLERLSLKHPAWAKQFIQLRKDPDTGELSWQGYNKPSVIEGRGDATVYSTRFKDEGFTEETDALTGMKIKTPTKDVADFWKREYDDTDYSQGATRAVGLLRTMEAAGNYRVTKLMSQNSALWNNFKKETESLTGQDINEAGAMQAAEKAIAKTYDMDKSVSSVAPHYAEWAIMDAINKHNNFTDYTTEYNKSQDNISAKIRLAGEPMLYQVMPEKFDKLHEIEGQMARDPRSVTKEDQRTYNQLKLDVTNATLEAMKDSPLSTAFKIQAADYEKKYKQHLKEVELLGTPDGQAALTLLGKQAQGYQLSERLMDYFPNLKKAQKEQKQIDQGSDKFSIVKSFIRGLRNSTESFRAGAMRELGFTEEGISNEVNREKSLEMDLRTPNRSEKEGVWNKIANFADQTSEFMGNMAPYIAITAATGGAGVESTAGFMMREGIPFFTSGYNDYYREAKGQGLDEGDAQLKGVLGGAALVLSQSFVPKGQMLDRGLINKEVADLVKEGAVDKSKLVNFFSKFIQGAAHGEAAVVVNGMADYAMNTYENATKGTHFSTDQMDPEHLIKQGLMFGIQASLMNSLARTDNKEAARAMVVKASETHPLTTLRAIDDAITLSKTDKTYDETALQRMKKDVSEAIQMKFPSDFSLEQRVATFDLVKKRQELVSEQADSDKEFHHAYESKIKYIDEQLRDIADKQTAAEKHLDKVSDPLYKQMEAEGYFDQPKKEKESSAPVAKKEDAPILIRHAESEANRIGVTGDDDTPLTQKGIGQAEELGDKLKAQGVKNVISSPMERSVQTADAIVEKTGGDVIVNNSLKEWNTGSEGSPTSDFDEKHWVDNPDQAPPGGEPFNKFLSRVQGAREQIAGVNKETAIVTHGKVLKLMDALDKTGGEWNDKAKAEFLKDKQFENAVPYKKGNKMNLSEEPAIEPQKPSHDEVIKEKYGRNPEEIIKQMKEEGALKIKCPPVRGTNRGSKFIKSLSNLK